MTDVRRIVIIGGSAAGAKAAARARRIDEEYEILILQKDENLSMASCAYPFYAEGMIPDRNMLFSSAMGVIRNPDFFLTNKNIEVKTLTQVTSINPEAHTVTAEDLRTGRKEEIDYYRLIIATGADPVMPEIPGMGLEGITAFHTVKDADFLKSVCEKKEVEKAVILGGGPVGLEVCEMLLKAGIDATVVESAPHIMNYLDEEMSMLAEKHIRARGVRIITGSGITEFTGKDGKLTGAKLADGTVLSCGLAVIAAGVKPNAELAKEAGLATGIYGGILVNQFMQTSDMHIYAAGDCVESTNYVSGANVYAPLGDLANIQGRTAGENAACGNKAMFTGTAQASICRFFDFSIGFCGLSEKKALADEWETVSSISAGTDKPFFMGGKLIITKLIMERISDRIIGAQCLGYGDVSRQISILATAEKGGLSVTDLGSADLPYSPAVSPAVDLSVLAAHVLHNQSSGLGKFISPLKLVEKMENDEKMFLLDVRTPDEFKRGNLGHGSVNIPLNELRERLTDIPLGQKTPIIVICALGARAWEAARLLKNKGWKNVHVLEGGITVWPLPLEK